jgi:methyl-accepting chemotaxis protein
MTELVAQRSSRLKLPTIRFRAKVMTGFAIVLAISALSLGFAYLGFERVSAGVASYRNSVSEADLARSIDRELISYRSLVRYYVVTGSDDDAKTAQAAEASLKAAIDQAMKGVAKAARLEPLTRLEREFRAFTKIFAEIIQAKRDAAAIVQIELARGDMSIDYKLDDIAGAAAEAKQEADAFETKHIASQFQAIKGMATTFVHGHDQGVATSAMTRLANIESALNAFSTTDPENVAGRKEVAKLFADYRQALGKLAENFKLVDDLVTEMSGSAGAIMQGTSAMKTDLVSDQERLASALNAIVGQTEQLIVLLAAGGIMLGGLVAFLLGRSISRPMTMMCRAMRDLAGGNFDVVLPGLGRRDELGEMAGAVEEFKLQAIAKAQQDAAEQDAQNKAAGAARRSELTRFADDFESAVGSIVSNVSASAVQLEQAAGTLTRTAETTQSLSSQVAGNSEEASGNIQSVATATEELSASVGEIGRQVRESSRIAGEAVAQAEATDQRIGKLSHAAAEIGDVVKLITAIAEQTNLLALNATIEAARAGDAGRGFAVVASEVKSLASQTARATDEISNHITGMQEATQESVAAIKAIGDTISEISDIAASIASAVEQQGAATREIAQNVQNVARGTRDAAANVLKVNRGATETGEASEEVLSSAKTLSVESTRLRAELDRFMANIRAA